MAMEYRMIEFVSYEGKFPNLCEGLLVVRIDGRLYAFSPYYDSMYRTFWNRFNRTEALEDDSITKVSGFYLRSGGYIDWGEDGENPKIVKRKWIIDDKAMKLENGVRFILSGEQKSELEKVINQNIELGCCGGCV